MEFPHEEKSIYYRYRATFTRDRKGNLLYCTGPEANRVREHWYSINVYLRARNSAVDVEDAPYYGAELDGDLRGLRLYESLHASNESSIGIIVDDVAGLTSAGRELDAFFVHLILGQADPAISYQPASNSNPGEISCETVTENIASLFDTYLRYQGQNDLWLDSGRAYFTERVRHFTSQGRKIEFCLPAFPCKSSNTDKVTGKDPDRGEQLALEHLHGFIEAVEKIYAAGAKLWIISDGHVFSDCIGVDDQDVDSYGEKLVEMNRAIGVRRGNMDRVGFKSLIDLFELETYNSLAKLADFTEAGIPPVGHYLQTRVTVEAELCRRILMAGFQSQRTVLRARIDSQETAALALYRGFARFMLEDLEHNPYTQAISRSKQKKLSAKIAFEMIMRNQAYSNLVEMLFPNHIRLSIHAHSNSGPKFGIRLFDTAFVRAVESLLPSGGLTNTVDLLHIPTPWHNSVVEIAGSKVLYLTKAKAVREAIATGGMVGELKTQSETADFGCAAYFSLRRNSVGADDTNAEAPKQRMALKETQETQNITMSKAVTTSYDAIEALSRDIAKKLEAAISHRFITIADNNTGFSLATLQRMLARLKIRILQQWELTRRRDVSSPVRCRY